MYNGSRFELPIKDLQWNASKKDRAAAQFSIDGRVRRAIFDFSKARPQELVNKELCLAILHPEVH